MTIYHSDCDGNEAFIRAGGECVCKICGKYYWEHPYCSNSRFTDGLDRDSYYLHVLCDGVHVKL